jgi:hypothetical protein
VDRLPPRRARAALEHLPGALRITVAPRRRWPAPLILLVWLGAWAFGEAAAVGQLARLSGTEASPAPLVVVGLWLVAWTAAGVAVARALLWMVFGRERVEAGGGRLRIRRSILGLGRTREFPGSDIRDLRVATAPAGAAAPGRRRRVGPSDGMVAFEHGEATVRLLPGIDAAEAAALVEQLAARLGGGASLRR